MSSYNKNAYLKFKEKDAKRHCDVCNCDLSYNAYANHIKSSKHLFLLDLQKQKEREIERQQQPAEDSESSSGESELVTDSEIEPEPKKEEKAKPAEDGVVQVTCAISQKLFFNIDAVKGGPADIYYIVGALRSDPIITSNNKFSKRYEFIINRPFS